MEENKKNNKKGIIIAGISAIVLIAVLGISFAFWNYSRTTDNQVLVTGDIFMKYTETNQLVIKNALPSKEPGENDYFEFKITGKNTYSKPIWYEIVLNHGVENPEGRTERLLDKFLMFKLVEIKGEEEQIVVDNASYEDITSKKIWVNTIPAGTKDNIEITYKLYMWISFDTKIGNTAGNDYDMETWNNQVYASVRVSVNGDFEEKELELNQNPNALTTIVKNTLIGYDNSSKEDFSGGLVAINTDGNLYNKSNSETIREYRYSGANVDNYITFNNETWRILGVFKEGNEEFVKIVRNEVLSENMLPTSYITNNTTYNLKSSKGETSNSVYWNYPTELNDKNYSDWTTAGLQYYLNSENDGNGNNGYLSYLDETSKNMIRDTTYYLGNFGSTYHFTSFSGGDDYFSDSPIQAFTNEKSNVICDSSKYFNSYDTSSYPYTGCSIWNGNKAIWNGKIGLLYGSDFGYSLTNNYWLDSLYFINENDYYNWGITSQLDDNKLQSSWLIVAANHNSYEWFISPSSNFSYQITYWTLKGHVEGFGFDIIDDSNNITKKEFNVQFDSEPTQTDYSMTVRPTLYLKSNVEVESGTGEEKNPYKIILPSA